MHGSWGNHARHLPDNIERFCAFFNGM